MSHIMCCTHCDYGKSNEEFKLTFQASYIKLHYKNDSVS